MRSVYGEISGDPKLTRKEQFIYLFYNFFRGIYGYRTYVGSRYWQPREIDNSDSSPSRKYINEFVKATLPTVLPRKNITVLDIGCGSGYIRRVLGQLGYSGSYTGVDVVYEKRFENHASTAFAETFVSSPIEQFNSNERYDLVVSMTSFEHIPDDFAAARKARELLAPGGVQIHIMPSFPSLFLYVFHGFRQYTPARVKALFAGQDYTVTRLGGIFSFILFFVYCTFLQRIWIKPVFARRWPSYAPLNRWANRLDKFVPIGSSMYAVVVKS